MKHLNFRPLLAIVAACLGLMLTASTPASAQYVYGPNGVIVVSGTVKNVNAAGVTLDTPNGRMTLPWTSTQFVIGGYPVAPGLLAPGMTVQANIVGGYGYTGYPAFNYNDNNGYWPNSQYQPYGYPYYYGY